MNHLQSVTIFKHVVKVILEAPDDKGSLQHIFEHNGISSLMDLLSLPAEYVDDFTHDTPASPHQPLEPVVSNDHKELIKMFMQWCRSLLRKDGNPLPSEAQWMK